MSPSSFKTAGAFLFCAMAIVGSARAQLDISLRMPNTTLLRGEPVPAVVTIQNNTAAQIPVGGNNGYNLSFDLRDSDSHSILPNEENPLFTLPLAPGATLVITNDLFRCFKLMGLQQASIMAHADYAGRSYTSKRFFLDFQGGTEIARLQVSSGKETLAHIFLVLRRGAHEHLFLRVDDEAGGWTYGATDLGTILRSVPPQFMLDSSGHTHMLQRSGPEEYSYRIAAADGTILKHELFRGDYRIIRMSAAPDGTITVNGKAAEIGERPAVLPATPMRPDLHRPMQQDSAPHAP